MKCYLCQQNTAFNFVRSKGRQQIKCSNCGLVFLDDKSRKKKVTFNDEKFLREYLIEENLFKTYFSKILDEVENLKKTGYLLDIGCGAGTFLELAKSRSWKVLGLDSSKAAMHYATRRKIKVINERVEKTRLVPNKFDIVSAFQAVEHFTDPLKVLKTIHKTLKPGGLLVITTPNRTSLLEKFMGNKWFGYYNREHLFVFDKQSFELLALKTGFEVIKSTEKKGRPLSFSWILTRLSDYYYDHKSTAKKLILLIQPIVKHFDWLTIEEPKVDLLLIARKV